MIVDEIGRYWTGYSLILAEDGGGAETTADQADSEELELQSAIDRLAATKAQLAAATAAAATVNRQLADTIRELDASRNEAATAQRVAAEFRDRLAQANASRLGRPAILRSWFRRVAHAPALSRLGWLLPNPLFDAEWYIAAYPDVARKRASAYRHYRRHGWREGRDPNPFFDTDWYLEQYSDVAASGMNPLDHYLHFGAAESRDPSPLFNTDWYAAANPDVAATGINPLLHYLRHGRREGRQPHPSARAPTTVDAPAASSSTDVRGSASRPASTYEQRGHYYSPLLGAADIARRADDRATALGVALDDQRLWDALEALSPQAHELASRGAALPANPFYGAGDAAVYHAMLRTRRPGQVVEVGSGFSTALALRATADLGTRLVAIDPDPSRLEELGIARDPRLRLIAKPVQDVELGVFEALAEGDFLFLDTSHVGKTGSDVLWLLFEVLPRLQAGVLVHVHDIFAGFEYPSAWMEEGRSWNEVYLLRAFLEFNSRFEIFLWPQHSWLRDPDRASALVPQLNENPGAQIWLRARS